MHINKSILFTGIKHCGKTTIAKTMSKNFVVPFFDTDTVLEDIFNKENDNTLTSREIYKKGKALFMKYETKAAAYIANNSKDKNLIVASGGGICDNYCAIDLLSDNFIFVYIEEDLDILYNRIIKKGLPAFLDSQDPYNNFSKIYAERTKKFCTMANVTINAEGLSAEKLFKKTLNQLLEEGYARK